MMTVIITLITYEDWVGSHPNPALVGNYMIRGGQAYQGDVNLMTQLVKRDWHTDPSPSEIDWIAVTNPPKPFPPIKGKAAVTNGHRLYLPGAAVTIVLNQKVGEYLNNEGQVVGHSPGGGKNAFSVTLAQGTDGRWRIFSIHKLDPSGGLGSLAK
jgi:hypothetical protein